jgi:glycosyltransferase involved in cell wall biosynthesis
MKFAFATVIYPEALKFLPNFLKSLRGQTYQNFHLVIVNDGCDEKDIVIEGLDFNIVPGGKSITENREILINAVLDQKFEWVIFGDSDDFFDSNRIEVIDEYSKDYDLISNDIIPVEGDKIWNPQFQKILGNFSEIATVFIRDKNLFGFSNTACRTEYIKNKSIPSEIIAVDWFLFAKAIQSGAKACFTAKTCTYYRQWEENIIGIIKTDIKQIKIGIKAKYFHYKNMLNYDPWYGGELPWLKNLYYQSDSENFYSYYKKLEQQKNEFIFWWENIKNYQL